MRKFLSMLLALTLSLSLAIPASAAGVGNFDNFENPEVSAPDVLNFRVPECIAIRMDADGVIHVSDGLEIANLSDSAIQVDSIRVAGNNGWDVVDFDSDFDDMADEVKNLAMSFRGDGTDHTGRVDLTDGNWEIAGNASLDLNVRAKMPKQSECESSSIATVYYSISWAEAMEDIDESVSDAEPADEVTDEIVDEIVDEITDEIVDETVEAPVELPEEPADDIEESVEPAFVKVMRGEHGYADVDELELDDDGHILVFPDVTADEGYEFDKWVDQYGNAVDLYTVFEDGDEIYPVFVEIEIESEEVSDDVEDIEDVESDADSDVSDEHEDIDDFVGEDEDLDVNLGDDFGEDFESDGEFAGDSEYLDL